MTARLNPFRAATRGGSRIPSLETESVPVEHGAGYYIRARRANGAELILESVRGPQARADAKADRYRQHLEGYVEVWAERIPADDYQRKCQRTLAAARNTRRTHCQRGHEFTPENTVWELRSSRENPYRCCRICKAENKRRCRQTTSTRGCAGK